MDIKVSVVTPEQLRISAGGVQYIPGDIRNYYTKTETYNQTEIDGKDSAILTQANTHSDTQDSTAKAIYDTHIKNVTFNNADGIFTFTRENGTTFTIDTALEKVATNFTYNKTKQTLDLTLLDGTTQSIDISEFITVNEFSDSNQIDFSVSNGVVTATIKASSITDGMLDSALKANLEAKSTAATNAAASALEDQKKAANSELKAANSESKALEYKNAAEAAAAITVKPPYIGTNKHWYVWSAQSNTFIDSGYTSEAIKSIQAISAPHTPGQSDTYRITYGNDITFDYSVYNGADGTAISEYNSRSQFPTTGVSGRIYIDLSTGISYRWTGSSYAILVDTTETDPVFSASAASGIKSTDISNWNSKTSNTGTVTSVSVKMNGSNQGTITSSGTIDLGTVLTAHQDISGKQDAATAVTHTASTSVGSTTTPIYIASNGAATALEYTIEKSVPSDAKFTDTKTVITYDETNHLLSFTQE